MATKKTADAADILKQLEESERDAYAEFERKQKEKRDTLSASAAKVYDRRRTP